MKLIVQIPCFNEEVTLPAVLRDIPRSIPGIDAVEVLIIDDGSTDATSRVARECGADHVFRFTGNRGLGHAMAAGFDRCLMLGADIIVNTDGDNQYQGADIPLLLAPILAKQADLVIGDRQIERVPHFSQFKKFLQKLGSAVVSRLARLQVPDAASGFRAYSRYAAMQLTFSTDFDHTVDHAIQAGRKRIRTVSVPIRTNEKLRESRLFSHIGVFVFYSAAVMARVYTSFRALRIFAALGLACFSFGVVLGLRFLYFYFFTNHGDMHVQSLILAAVFLLAGFNMVLTGIVADLINTSRQLIEDLSFRLRRMELREQEFDKPSKNVE